MERYSKEPIVPEVTRLASRPDLAVRVIGEYPSITMIRLSLGGGSKRSMLLKSLEWRKVIQPRPMASQAALW